MKTLTSAAFWRNELFGGWTKFESALILGLVAAQIVVFAFFTSSDDLSGIGVLVGITGILCVTFAAKGKLLTYFFGLIQVVGYLYISFQSALYGEVMLNVFYLVMQFVGAWIWFGHLTKQKTSASASAVELVTAKSLSANQWTMLAIAIPVIWLGFGAFLNSFGSAQPYLDSIAVSLSVLAQVLMSWRYKEQWMLWIIVNLFYITLWVRADQLPMVVMYCGFLINSIYGFINWNRLAKTDREKEPVVDE